MFWQVGKSMKQLGQLNDAFSEAQLLQPTMSQLLDREMGRCCCSEMLGMQTWHDMTANLYILNILSLLCTLWQWYMIMHSSKFKNRRHFCIMHDDAYYHKSFVCIGGTWSVIASITMNTNERHSIPCHTLHALTMNGMGVSSSPTHVCPHGKFQVLCHRYIMICRGAGTADFIPSEILLVDAITRCSHLQKGSTGPVAYRR